MCGIAGLVRYDKQITRNEIETLSNSLIHRGPDYQNFYLHSKSYYNLVLIHTRLSIIDLSNAGNQPMHFKHLSIVFNGEIYNFAEIRAQLENLGYQFKSTTDTEVVLYAFYEWGVESVHKFIGFFAFAIYNSQLDEIILFRDRTGIKPIYFTFTSFLAFSSELKTLMEIPEFKKDIDLNALTDFIQLGYVPAPKSIFKDCHKLNPGHYAIFNLVRRTLDIKKYWSIDKLYSKEKVSLSLQEATNKLEELLISAFNYRMISDVPVGVFLSSGYDSTLVTAILQANQSKKIDTYTIGIFDDKYNEAVYAKEIARYLGTNHHEYYCTEEEAQSIIFKLPEIYDEPFGDSSAIPTILVSKMAKLKVKVALSADGGDEIFGGYNSYQRVLKNTSLINNLPPLLIRFVKSLSFLKKFNLPNSVDYILNNEFDQFNIYSNMLIYFNKKIRKANLIKLMRYPLDSYHLGIQTEQAFDPKESMLLLDYKYYLPDDILTKVDRATMSVSLEGREPFLDHRIIEFAVSLDFNYKINEKGGKFIIKELTHKYVPSSLVERPKSGFSIPLAKWLRTDLKFLIDKYLNSIDLNKNEYFEPVFVNKLVNDFLNGSTNSTSLIWNLLMFQMWKERWM